MGDFNLPDVFFSSEIDGLNFNGLLIPKSQIIYDATVFNDFQQFNSFINVSGSQLDLIFSNILNLSVSISDEVLVPPDKYHLVLNVSYNNYNTIVNASKDYVLDYSLKKLIMI